MLTNKTQLLTVAIALLIPFAAHAQPLPNDIGGTAADPDDNQQLQDVHLVTTDIVIDGDRSEWSFNNPIIDPLIGIPKIGRDGRVDGDPPSDFVVHEALGGTWTGPEDQSSTTQFVWKTGTEDGLQDGLYMGLIVTDDYHENAANSGWNGDSVQMMVTFYDSDFEEHDPADFALYNFALGGVEGELDPEDPAIVAHLERGFSFFGPPDDFVEVAIARDSDAQETFYELFLGLDALGVDDWEVGTQLGIGMAINDGDEDFPGQAGWVGLGAHAIVFGKTPSEVALLTLAEELVVVVDPFLPADFNKDGTVNLADFLRMSVSFGKNVGDPTGDVAYPIVGPEIDLVGANGQPPPDGVIGLADFLQLSTTFGQSSGGVAAVPEPSGIALLVLGGCAMLLRRRHG